MQWESQGSCLSGTPKLQHLGTWQCASHAFHVAGLMRRNQCPRCPQHNLYHNRQMKRKMPQERRWLLRKELPVWKPTSWQSFAEMPLLLSLLKASGSPRWSFLTQCCDLWVWQTRGTGQGEMPQRFCCMQFPWLIDVAVCGGVEGNELHSSHTQDANFTLSTTLYFQCA